MSGDTGAGAAGWHDDEVVSAGLPDKRLARRFGRLLDEMSAAPGQPVSAACGEWAATKAAYCFFDNSRVTDRGMLAGHFAATAMRCAASEGQSSFCRIPPSSSTAVRSRVRSASPSPSTPDVTRRNSPTW